MVLIDIDTGKPYRETDEEVDLDEVLTHHWDGSVFVYRDRYGDEFCGDEGAYEEAARPWDGSPRRREAFDDETADPILEPFPNSASTTLRLRDSAYRWYLFSRRNQRVCLLTLLLAVAVAVVTALGMAGVHRERPTVVGNATNGSNGTLLKSGPTEPTMVPAEFLSPSPSPWPATSNVNSTEPTTPLPAAPWATQAPTTPDHCPNESAAVRDCFARDASSSNSSLEAAVALAACEACVRRFWPEEDGTANVLAACDDNSIRGDACAALRDSDCHCGNCAAPMEVYLECRSNCTFGCDGDANQGTAPKPAAPSSSLAPNPSRFTSSPTASPAPTVTPQCPDEDAAFNVCADAVDGGSSEDCLFCLLSYWPPTSTGSVECLTVVDATCLGLVNCTCGGCASDFVSLVVCLTGCPAFECR